ncbi:peptidoglycan DD-metalloendopeptidase family protein [Crenobacter cavernae]|uniref:LysM peptidoglycan-binding domain-containing protein n=1 Tax=Crenobacter cavernae TaxID=2290923 RepID=A0A345Y694_9NEIS|nr:peptidoglycan DD-metalloendopeptidase family protein [Crenobacter cavernae]AXK39446.1 LysM peptidoglycan-binding domain-containing protein [Crenobacter cavernae]
MSKNHLYRSFACVSLVAGLSACTSLTQSGAPIESGSASRQPSSSDTRPAPVKNGGNNGSSATTTPLSRPVVVRPDVRADGTRATTHAVQAGETLYRIAFNNELKYQDLAAWNQLPADFSIKAGQTLRLTPPDGGAMVSVTAGKPATAAPVAAGTTAALKPYPKALKLPYSETAIRSLPAQSEGTTGTGTMPVVAKPETSRPEAIKLQTAKTDGGSAENGSANSAEGAVAGGTDWIWPTQGKVMRGFSDSNKGIDIAGKSGQPVLAVGGGKVVYSGAGLRGYGKLIIIKHDKTYLTAYAHNSQLLVKEGQDVKKGQKIAEMGNSDADQVKLHFEVRRFGKPVDPTQYLDNQS